jgi:hypothetical protein
VRLHIEMNQIIFVDGFQRSASPQQDLQRGVVKAPGRGGGTSKTCFSVKHQAAVRLLCMSELLVAVAMRSQQVPMW